MLLLLVFFAGCAAPTVQPAENAPTRTPERATVPPATDQPVLPDEDGSQPSDLELPPDAVIFYQRSGGFAGVMEAWTIFSDGRVTSNDGKEWQVPREQIERLLTTIDELGFFHLESSYLPKNVCCDLFFYELTVSYNQRLYRVDTVDGAAGTPDELWQILEEVTSLLDSGK